MDIIIDKIKFNNVDFHTGSSNLKYTNNITILYEVFSDDNTLKGELILNENQLGLEGLKEKISEKIKEILK